MPLYLVSSKKILTTSVKHQIANLIVDTHCSITGAPETFVNVVFSEAFPLRKAYDLDILATVRKGRTEEVNQRLKDTLKYEMSEILKLPANRLNTTLTEVPASWVMEGLILMPEPGEEDSCVWSS